MMIGVAPGARAWAAENGVEARALPQELAPAFVVPAA